jgi:hypothetical protein
MISFYWEHVTRPMFLFRIGGRHVYPTCKLSSLMAWSVTMMNTDTSSFLMTRSFWFMMSALFCRILWSLSHDCSPVLDMNISPTLRLSILFLTNDRILHDDVGKVSKWLLSHEIEQGGPTLVFHRAKNSFPFRPGAQETTGTIFEK